MRLCIFEDAAVSGLEPLCFTRPAWALRVGASTLLERQQRSLGTDEIGVLIRPELADLCRLQYPQLPINDAQSCQGPDLVLINARWLPPANVTIDSRAHVGLVNDQVAYVRPAAGIGELGPDSLPEWLDHCRQTLPGIDAGGTMIQHLWDLVDGNADVLKQDWQWFACSRRIMPPPSGVALVGPADKLAVAEDAVVEAFVFVDTRSGPVLIDRGAVVHSFSRLEGPCYIGPDSVILGAKLRGGSIGPQCRIGGEVEASILQGHSNKYHDGFLGHSYVGAWVNLAAGTQTSDLRNDYGKVRVSVGGQQVATGLGKVGSFLGDHTKTGLGALLNTGSVIGTFCNLLPTGSLLPRTVPSFCQVNHGQIQEQQDLRQLFSTAATVMSRRGETFTEAHRELFYHLFDSTTDIRRRAIRDGEIRQLRRSI
jgi:UDP-N-acetylglucosamine diphosphorylase/glucosamine-1-phosphate N-acetyltransferase